MDPIRNQISGADPIGRNAGVPDGQEALEAMFRRPGLFTDRVIRDVPSVTERRQRRARVAGLLTVAAAAVTAGVVLAANLGPLTATPAPAGTVLATASSTARATPDPTPSFVQTPTPAVSSSSVSLPPAPTQPPAPAPAPWSTFTDQAGQVTFEVPAGWTAQEVPAGAPDYPATSIEVTDESGKKVATFFHGAVGGLGGACGPEQYPVTELDSAPYLADWDSEGRIRFSYRVLDRTGLGAGLSYQTGLVDESSGRLTDTCLMYSLVNRAPRGTLSFADRAATTDEEPVFQTMAEAKAYMGTEEYRKLKDMILSLALSP